MNDDRQKTAEKETPVQWHNLSIEDVARSLNSDPEKGLSDEEAKARLVEYGHNKLPEAKRKPFLIRLLSHYNNVLIYILLVAAVATALLDHWIDTWVILAVVIINGVVGFIQEGKAEKSLEAIRGMLSLHAQVVRGGRRLNIDAEGLVPGDVVLIGSGDKIPADVRLLSISNLRIEESALTGESVEVDKKSDAVDVDAGIGDRFGMAYSGTTARYGNARAMAVATGSNTELGKINTMMSETEELTTPLIKKINHFGKGLSIVIVIFSALILAFGLLVGSQPFGELFLAVIGMAVAAIPEGLPAILTITLAIGVQRMAKRNAIIRKLPSVETLGSVTTICSDKTGTLTKNEMTVERVFTFEKTYNVEGAGYDPSGRIMDGDDAADLAADPVLKRLLQTNRFCNTAELAQDDAGNWIVNGPPTEGALLTLAYKGGLDDATVRQLDEIPFDSAHKYSAVLCDLDDERLLLMNGAPERLLDRCAMQLSSEGPVAIDRAYWGKRIEDGAGEGLRMLGSAFRVADDLDSLDSEELGEMIFIGLAGMIDPPRPEAIRAIEACHRAGITVKMITGDHALTASVIGKKMGIGDGREALTGSELEKMDDAELQDAAARCDIFARTSPEHKLRLVRALQANGEVCAMTGDGVNDAPALKQAEIGIAMGIKGTEVTKDAAAMVLADDNFASIANAVEEGRTIYDNLRKTLLFILPTNGAEALMVIIGILAGAALPITPVQILWINMVTAVTLALAIAVEPKAPDIMDRPPRSANAPMLGRYFGGRILYVSLLLGVMIYVLFTTLVNGGHSIDAARTVAVNALVMGELFYLFNCRYITEPALGRTFWQNKIAFIVSGALIVLQMGLTYLPFMNTLFGTQSIQAVDWAYPLAVGAVVFVVVEIEKTVTRKLADRKKTGLKSL